jgi:hypothetical protein
MNKFLDEPNNGQEDNKSDGGDEDSCLEEEDDYLEEDLPKVNEDS